MSDEDKHLILQQFKWSLQALAIAADDQFSLFPDFVLTPDELMLDFGHWFSVAKRFDFTPRQRDAIQAIDELIDRMSNGGDLFSEALYADSGLREDNLWVELRQLAKDALHEFGWPPDVPPSGLSHQRTVRR